MIGPWVTSTHREVNGMDEFITVDLKGNRLRIFRGIGLVLHRGPLNGVDKDLGIKNVFR